MVMDQVKKAQEQFNDNPTIEEIRERFDALQSDLNERFESAQAELNERFDEATNRLVDANEKVAGTVSSRVINLPGASRLPQPTEVVTSYFDAIERITATNRDLALKLVGPWMTSAQTTPAAVKAPAKKKATARKRTAKATARKTSARKTTARKTPARKTTARKATAAKTSA